MADLALDQAADPQVKALAAKIKAAQDPEIVTMRQWLTTWGVPQEMEGMGDSTMDHSVEMPMPGMMTEAQMSTLTAATGPAFDRLWLQMMIAHHEGALTMAEGVLASTTDEQVTALAKSVMTGQSAEITTMKKLLGA
jgi:uncharacterized protein (DUF305 family)